VAGSASRHYQANAAPLRELRFFLHARLGRFFIVAAHGFAKSANPFAQPASNFRNLLRPEDHECNRQYE